ncbi:MAG: hypothetical protein KF749_12075 [Bacteroidetes bacterium]|nr:hypothetical protein [Bacteroidota bacterium]MCW5894242.1 hypothetical protein [Bacteroidota bacterium]
MRCEYSQQLYLPELSKLVIYLDQFFLSHAFRSKVAEFVDCVELISELAHNQLIVCPMSSVHETETHQWRDSRADELWKFIKRTSRGQAFEPTYRVKHDQIMRGFTRYLSQDTASFPISREDALDDINVWDDYFWIDTGGKPDNVELTRKLKDEAVTGLVGLFPKWRKSEMSFEDHQAYELRSGGNGYIQLYLQKWNRLASGDLSAIYNSPIDSQIVENMVRHLEDEKGANPLLIAQTFFASQYYARVPYEYISSGIITVLRDRVKTGQFSNPEKAIDRLQGLFFDMDFIAAYAPYCDAMFVDAAMLPLVTDERLELQSKYGVKFFAKTNWNAFLAYLESIKTRKTPELARAIDLVYPRTKGIRAKA